MGTIFWTLVLVLVICISLNPNTWHQSISHQKARRKNRFNRPKRLKGKTVGYIVIIDGYGKFGITTCRDGNQHKCVRRRYGGKKLNILWTKTFPSRDVAYLYEKWCKTRVSIIKGNEWFRWHQAMGLVREARRRWR